MQNRNILNNFKSILGEYCAINQFVELAKRNLLSEHSSTIDNEDSFIEFANKYSLTLTYYDSEKMVNTISKSYIVNVHLCFEIFLKEFSRQINHFGKKAYQERGRVESWLENVCRNIFDARPNQELEQLIDICEYYRLIRNSAVHDLSDDKELVVKYSKLIKHNYETDLKYKKLSAPNCYNDICFDDFVMFSRSCLELAVKLYEAFELDYEKIILDVSHQKVMKWRTFDQNRCESAIFQYMMTNFKDSEAVKNNIAKLVDLVKARSSNG